MSSNGIGALLGANTFASTAQASTTANAAKPKESERDMFMTLLVTQLKNQDPLEPQDGAQFVAQLAQFNSLDQLIGIKQSIDQLITLANAPAQTGSTE
jgi:flagellar basal-body rod modification protein FlgD